MKVLIQRVKRASVSLQSGGKTPELLGSIEKGLLALVGFERSDSQTTVDKAIKKLMNYRLFADEQDHMNLSLLQTQGGLLLVSQFTLVAETDSGLRPSFSRGAEPEQGLELFNQMVDKARINHETIKVESGIFAADMLVSLENDGPVTFMLNIQ